MFSQPRGKNCQEYGGTVRQWRSGETLTALLSGQVCTPFLPTATLLFSALSTQIIVCLCYQSDIGRTNRRKITNQADFLSQPDFYYIFRGLYLGHLFRFGLASQRSNFAVLSQYDRQEESHEGFHVYIHPSVVTPLSLQTSG